jgi:hypothetical protein
MAFAQHNQPQLKQVQLPLRREHIALFQQRFVCENLWSKPKRKEDKTTGVFPNPVGA